MIRFELNKGRYEIKLERFLKKLGGIVFREFKKSGIISVAYVSGAKIREYNKKYRQKNKATDILTFVLGEKDCPGEIILSPVDVKKRAKNTKKSLAETEICLIIHGVCHIFGLAHKNKKDTLKMEKVETKILRKLKMRQR